MRHVHGEMKDRLTHPGGLAGPRVLRHVVRAARRANGMGDSPALQRRTFAPVKLDDPLPQAKMAVVFSPQTIPDEVWSLVFAHVDEETMLRSVAVVCRHFRNLCAHRALPALTLRWAGPIMMERLCAPTCGPFIDALLRRARSFNSVDFAPTLISNPHFVDHVFGPNGKVDLFAWHKASNAKFERLLPIGTLPRILGHCAHLVKLEMLVNRGDVPAIRAVAGLKSLRILRVKQAGGAAAPATINDLDLEAALVGIRLTHLMLWGFPAVSGAFVRVVAATLTKVHFVRCGIVTVCPAPHVRSLCIERQLVTPQFVAELCATNVETLCLDRTHVERGGDAGHLPPPPPPPSPARAGGGVSRLVLRFVCWPAHDGDATFATLMAHTPRLEVVDLTCSKLSDAAFHALLHLGDGGRRPLYELNARGVRLSATTLRLLKKAATLRKFMCTDLPPDAANPGSLSLACLPRRLVALDLTSTPWVDATCIGGLLRLTKMRRLSLRNCAGVDDATLAIIAPALRDVKAINLVGCSVTPACMGGAVRHFRKLEHLFVGSACVGDGEGFRDLRELKHLTAVNVTSVETVRIEHFAVLAGHASMQTLGLQCTRVTGPCVRNGTARGSIGGQRATEYLAGRVQVQLYPLF
jgi:hypothetical protein